LTWLLVIPAIGSSLVCFVLLPFYGIIRNYLLYNYFSLSTYWDDAAAAGRYGWAPVYLILLPVTALGLYLYLRLKRRFG
jgi:hypothetical protein